jgi:hypothetical protein
MLVCKKSFVARSMWKTAISGGLGAPELGLILTRALGMVDWQIRPFHGAHIGGPILAEGLATRHRSRQKPLYGHVYFVH